MQRHRYVVYLQNSRANLARCRERSTTATTQAMAVRLKRAYELPEPSDGYRVLIDRLWPRGLTKERLPLDEWARELGPSTELRRWFGHDPDRFGEFRRRYLTELEAREEKVRELRRRARAGTLTLVYSARDTEHNNAVVLAELLRRSRLASRS